MRAGTNLILTRSGDTAFYPPLAARTTLTDYVGIAETRADFLPPPPPPSPLLPRLGFDFPDNRLGIRVFSADPIRRGDTGATAESGAGRHRQQRRSPQIIADR